MMSLRRQASDTGGRGGAGQIEGVGELAKEVLTEFVPRIEARIPTPPLNDTPCPYVLVCLEWVGSAEGVEGGLRKGC